MKIQDLAQPRVGDIVEFETQHGTVVEGMISDITEDGYVFEFSLAGEQALLEDASGYIPKNSQEAQDPRWSSALTQDVTTHTMRDQIQAFYPTAAIKDGQEQVKEAEYQGRKVKLGKPMAGDVKKFKVYVKDPKTGNVKKVNFGDKTMRIKKRFPKRRKSFRARHRCHTARDRTTARYWSCRMW